MSEVPEKSGIQGDTPDFADPDATLQNFHKALLAWWRVRKRKFPWRETSDPYHVLMSELMLRRTRADQVVNVYLQFIERYPDPNSLASAPPDDVADALYSLGLAWRIPAFQKVAEILNARFNGTVPNDYASLKELPGVGDYVASAVCSLAFQQPRAIVDTNTVRIVGRLFGIPTHAESRRRKPIRDLHIMLLNKKYPRDHNYALLDLAALVCTPRDPACEECPLLSFCNTGQKNYNA